MKNIVCDTNIFLSIALGEKSKERIIQLTTGVVVYAPSVLPFEIHNALANMVNHKQITENEAFKARDIIAGILVTLKDVSDTTVLQTAVRNGIYAYDAYFLVCAFTTKYPLMTLDKKMGAIAKKTGIPIIEI